MLGWQASPISLANPVPRPFRPFFAASHASRLFCSSMFVIRSRFPPAPKVEAARSLQRRWVPWILAQHSLTMAAGEGKGIQPDPAQALQGHQEGADEEHGGPY